MNYSSIDLITFSRMMVLDQWIQKTKETVLETNSLTWLDEEVCASDHEAAAIPATEQTSNRPNIIRSQIWTSRGVFETANSSEENNDNGPRWWQKEALLKERVRF